jgi:hypothetical protein
VSSRTIWITLHHYVLSRIIQLDHNQILSTKENLFNKCVSKT